ncbi:MULTISPECIES: cupin domain-containing protein [Gammaproteobacteria]|uniref:cupin domain-containing protein n=1 Tax=Gammaproteobacteria TaxID=1236 RepID=UPI001911F4BB|nr:MULTISPECIES: cupin domain-containing protein [Gammaproteobacteria]MBK5302124.1 cupin domain-containing protein [Bacillus sp. TH86]MBK5321893.1 cupin domain-containing protein [Bacillus sp. TH59]MBK5336843.1 cupin domain-containing protein [Bacillus sp. TH57]MBK5310906.1 cupin domain-containing protein [Pseudomonas sp. TH71]MBK5316390.1 cupin domain-containing protein [Erwinia sp. TH79]
MFTRYLLAAAFAALSISAASAAEPHAGKVTVVFDRPIPNLPGKSMKGVLVEYGPGAASPSHTHPKTAFIYATVLEGSFHIKVKGQPEKIYNVGENFVEEPGSVHEVSANASDTKPARLLAVFVLDSNEKELVTPIKK